MRVVIDTNVLISATFWTGRPKQLLNKVRRGEVIYLTSRILLDELKEILIRADKPFKLSENDARKIVAAAEEMAELVQTHSKFNVCRDEKDNCVLECAVDGKAEWIITGDMHLLKLQFFQEIPIVKVAEFLSKFEIPLSP